MKKFSKQYRTFIVSKSKKRKRTKREYIPDRFNDKKEDIAVYHTFVPSSFDPFKNTDQVLLFFKDIKEKLGEASKNIEKRHVVFISFSELKYIQEASFLILLSIVRDYKPDNVTINYIAPKNKVLDRQIKQSGFMNYVNDYSKKNELVDYTKRNYILKDADIVDSEEWDNYVSESIEYLTGKPDTFPPLYDILTELSTNAFDHAFVKNKDAKPKWWFTFIKSKNKVSVIFLDNGHGILNTLKFKLSQKIDQLNNQTIIQKALNGEYRSRTKKNNRGQGLGYIKDQYSNGYVTSLEVITNSVKYDLDKNKVLNLKTEFTGTLYKFDVTKETVEKYG